MIRTYIGTCCYAATVLYILWNAKHFSILVENNYQVCFQYTDFHISINPFTAIPGCWQMCVRYIFCEGRLIAISREGSNGPMHLNMKNKIFPLTSNIIHPKVLTLRYPV